MLCYSSSDCGDHIETDALQRLVRFEEGGRWVIIGVCRVCCVCVSCVIDGGKPRLKCVLVRYEAGCTSTETPRLLKHSEVVVY